MENASGERNHRLRLIFQSNLDFKKISELFMPHSDVTQTFFFFKEHFTLSKKWSRSFQKKASHVKASRQRIKSISRIQKKKKRIRKKKLFPCLHDEYMSHNSVILQHRFEKRMFKVFFLQHSRKISPGLLSFFFIPQSLKCQSRMSYDSCPKHYHSFSFFISSLNIKVMIHFNLIY